MYEDIMQGRRGLADIVVNSDEDVVIANSDASNDLLQDAFAGIKQLFEPVGGGPYPYVETVERGPVRFGDIAVNSSGAEGYDMQQEAFADDMLTSGDEGIGFAQARRLKSKLRRNRRRITETGYAVAGGSPYQFGDLGKIRISFKNPFGKKSLFGKAKKLVKKIKPLKVAAFVGSGILGSKLLSTGFNLAKGALTRGGGGGEQPEAVAVSTTAPAGVPVPAPTGATDAVGTPIPASIQQAMTSGASPIPAAAPTASEDVAAQVQQNQTDNTMEAGVAGPFTMPNFSDPKVLLTLGAVGILIFSQMGKKGSHRRSRRR